MDKVVDRLRRLNRYRVPIIATLVTILVLSAAFLFTRGMIYGATLKDSTIEYGTQPSFSAGALFSDIRYEYYAESTGEWSEEVPYQIGSYRVRAISKGSFGEKYGREQQFQIVPRNIEVVVDSDTLVYGESPRVEGDVVYGDTVYCDSFLFADNTLSKTTVTPVLSSVVVKDKSGQDVSSHYSITVKDKLITFEKRELVLTIESKDKTYDGAPLTHQVWQTSENGCVYGDIVVKVEGSFSSITNAGSIDNKGEFLVVRPTDGGVVDVTHQYKIKQIYGKLTVDKKEILVHPHGGEYIYDGLEHSESGFIIDASTPLVEGHTASVSQAPVIVNVGNKENILLLTISDGTGADVTSNYCFTFDGTMLKVVPKEITVVTESGTITYDGFDHSFDGCVAKDDFSVLEGHRLVVKSASAFKEAKIYENVLTAGVLDENGQDVTANYHISYENGTVEITKRIITIKSEDLNGIYSGKPQSAQVVSSGLEELCLNHKIVAEFKNTILECGEEIENDFTAIIVDENGVDVTENYITTFINGVLRLEPLPLFLITGSMERDYDATPLTSLSFTYALGSGEIVEGHTVKYISPSSITKPGEVENKFEIKIYDAQGVDKTFNYAIDFLEYGKLIVLQRPVLVSVQSASKEYYDGKPVENPGYTATGIVEGHREEITLVMENDTYAGTWKNTVEGVLIYDENGEDVTDCYIISHTDGEITIGRRPVTVVSYGFDSVVYYDGEKHTNHKYAVDTSLGLDIVEGETLVATFLSDSYVEYATQSRSNVFNIIGVYNDNDENLTPNYIFTSIYGELVLAPRPITIISGSHKDDEVVYDGEYHKKQSYEISLENGSLGLVSGHRITISYLSSIIDAGEMDNEIKVSAIRDRAYRNVAENYEITYIFGKLKVNKRTITLTSQSADRVYNGVALTNKNVVLGGLGLAKRETIEYGNFASITNVGFVKNTFDYIIYNKNGEDVTEKNYDITTDFSAELTVTKRPITITINSHTRVYNGEVLCAPSENGFSTPMYEDYLTSGEGLLPNHMISIDLSGEIYKVGTLTILWSNLKIIDTDEGGIGELAKDNYEITVIDGTLSITQRDIALELKQEEKEYDAEPLLPTFTGEDVGGLGLATGDRIEVVLSGSQTNKGTSNSTLVEYKIYNPQGEDVTFCYNPVSIKDGTLTVRPRKIIVTILGGYREYYDGGAVVSGGYTVERLLDYLGHVITLEIAGEQINVGSGKAVLVEGSLVITDQSGEDITENYESTVIEGVLTVEKKRPITITSATDKFIYDGKPHKNEGYEIGGMGLATAREEKEIVFFASEPMINAGIYDNKFTVEIVTAHTMELVTGNYDITYVYGTITIEKIVINITTGSAVKVFDGVDLTNHIFTCISPNLPSNETIDIEITGVIKYVGSQTNTYTIRVLDENGQEKPIGNYEIIEELGTLTVEPLEITITSGDAEKVYDGTPLTNNSYISNWKETEAYKQGVLNLSVVVSGSRTEIGRSGNNVMARLYDENGEDITSGNCEITYVKGSLTVYAPPIEFVSMSTTGVFTGDYVRMEYIKLLGEINKKEHTVKAQFASEVAENGMFVYAGEYANEFTVDIVDKNGNSVLEFYPNITCTFGTIKIEPYAITITPISSKEQYNGSPLYPSQAIVEPNRDLDRLNSYNLDNVFTYYIDEMKDIFVSAPGETLYFKIPADRFHIRMNGEDVPDSCFSITSEEGYLSLAAVLIEINVYTVTGTYNGKYIGYEEDEWYLRDDQLSKIAEGHRMEIKLVGGRIEAGTVDFDEMIEEMLATGNIRVYDSDDNDVTATYDFKLVGTPLTVKQRFVQITAGSAEKIYDGSALKSEEYSITGGKLAGGHSIKKCYISGEQTGVGTSANCILSVVIVDANGNNVTGNYSTEFIDGILEVLEDPQDKN